MYPARAAAMVLTPRRWISAHAGTQDSQFCASPLVRIQWNLAVQIRRLRERLSSPG